MFSFCIWDKQTYITQTLSGHTNSLFLKGFQILLTLLACLKDLWFTLWLLKEPVCICIYGISLDKNIQTAYLLEKNIQKHHIAIIWKQKQNSLHKSASTYFVAVVKFARVLQKESFSTSGPSCVKTERTKRLLLQPIITTETVNICGPLNP